ncbi:hypothetical protein ABTH25_19555, partial [Acinetobacter baumannii]
MTRKSKRANADAVWDSNKGLAADERSRKDRAKTTKEKPATRTAQSNTAAKRVTKLPDFIEPQLCASVDNPPSGSN